MPQLRRLLKREKATRSRFAPGENASSGSQAKRVSLPGDSAAGAGRADRRRFLQVWVPPATAVRRWRAAGGGPAVHTARGALGNGRNTNYGIYCSVRRVKMSRGMVKLS